MSGVVIKSSAELDIMHRANEIVQGILDDMADRVRPGVTTAELDLYAEKRIIESGGVPAFKGYPHRGDGNDFPGSLCTSVNDEVVHGVPSPRVVLADGDTISIDLGVKLEGFYGDGARTYAVGPITDDDRKLLDVTRQALDLGIEQVRPGNRVTDIGHAVQAHVEANGFAVVREFVGHGIGAQLHEEPQVPNFGPPGRRERLQPGMVLAIEPMVNAGTADVMISADDGWTARTRDGSRSAHFEVCVAVTDDGPWVLGRVGRAAVVGGGA